MLKYKYELHFYNDKRHIYAMHSAWYKTLKQCQSYLDKKLKSMKLKMDIFGYVHKNCKIDIYILTNEDKPEMQRGYANNKIIGSRYEIDYEFDGGDDDEDDNIVA